MQQFHKSFVFFFLIFNFLNKYEQHILYLNHLNKYDKIKKVNLLNIKIKYAQQLSHYLKGKKSKSRGMTRYGICVPVENKLTQLTSEKMIIF